MVGLASGRGQRRVSAARLQAASKAKRWASASLFPKGVDEDVRPKIRELWQRQLNARPYTSNRRRIQLRLDGRLRHGLQLRPHVGEGMVVEAEPEFDQSGIEQGDAVVEIAGHPLELGDIDTIKMKFNENVKDGVLCRIARRF